MAADRSYESGTSWNYRVIRFKNDRLGGSWYEIREVYYHDNVPAAYNLGPIGVGAETPLELEDQFDKLRRALREPVLSVSDFPAVEGSEYG
jgi:hypothetical protein